PRRGRQARRRRRRLVHDRDVEQAPGAGDRGDGGRRLRQGGRAGHRHLVLAVAADPAVSPARPRGRDGLGGGVTAMAARPRDPHMLAAALFGAVFVVGLPLANAVGLLSDYYLNLFGKYLALALVALGMDLIWGYAGILSLGQAIF